METIALKGLRKKHGAYYFDAGRDENGRRKWHHLGRERDAALRRYAALRGVDASEAAILERHLRKIYLSAKQRAKSAGIEFQLSRDDYAEIVRRAGWCCEMTGIPFSMSWSGKSRHRRPYVPSLDRIDSFLPYSMENCRLVLCAVNYALNEWGEDVFARIAAGMVDVSTKAPICRPLE